MAPPNPPWMKRYKLPLINRLIEGALEPVPMEFNAALEKALVALRPFSAVSVVDAALRALQTGHLSRVDKVRSAPWLALLLVKWKLLQSAAPVHFGKVIPQAEFDRLRLLLWRTDSGMDPQSLAFNAMTMVRALLAVQMEFQRSTNAGFMRWPALITRLPQQHVNRRQFEEAIGMDAESFMDIGMVTHTAAKESQIVQRSYFAPMRPAYGAKIDAYLALVSRSLPDLRDEVRADPSQQTRARSEVKELPYLRRYPLLQLDDQRLISWHPDVLARGLEDATHLRLSRFGDAYAERFGPVFEEYVLELVSDAGVAYLGEREIQRRAASPTKTVEALIDSDGCNVFLEAKMGLFADQLLVRDDSTYLYDRTKNIRTAIEQGWATSELVRSKPEAFGNCAKAEQDFLLVVTSRELYLGGGLILQSLYPPGRFDYPEGEVGLRLRKVMPLQNIFVVSIAEFEVVMGHVRASSRSLGAVLRKAALANAEPRTSAYTLAMHLDKLPERKGPDLIRKAMNDCGRRLGQALDPSNPSSPSIHDGIE
jgi:hypothetical protein